MAVARVQSKGNNGGAVAGTSLVGNLTSNATQGNLLIAFLSAANSPTISAAPSGWTLLRGPSINGNIRSWLYAKVAGASEGNSWTWTLSGGNAWSAEVHELSGATSDLAKILHSLATASSVTSINTPSVTTVSANSFILSFVNATSGANFGTPSGTTKDDQQSTGVLGNNVVTAQYHDNSLQASPGATTSRNVTFNGSVGSALAMTVAVPDPSVALVPDACGIATTATATASTPQPLGTPSAAIATTATATVAAPTLMAPDPVAATFAASGAAVVGKMPYWKEAFRKFKAGTGKATAIALGDSITEGYNAGALVRSADGWPARAGLDLARAGGKSWASRYLPTAVVQSAPPTFDDAIHGFGWPEGSSPWTYNGSIFGRTNDGGLGLRGIKIVSSAGYVEVAAPSWATHAVVQFAATNRLSMSIASNGTVVHAQDVTDTAEKSVVVPLNGSGNLLRVTCVDASIGYLFVNGVVWQKDAHPAGMILSDAKAVAAATLGGTATVDISGITTGSLMVAVAAQTNGATSAPPLPAGWTSRDTWLGTNVKYRVFTRTKQAGDTTCAVTASGVINTDVAIHSFKNASWGQISASFNATASGSVIDPPALDVTMGDASVLIGGFATSGVVFPFTVPANYFPGASTGNQTSIGIAYRTFGIEADQNINPPSVATAAANTTDRVAWHIDLIRTNNDRSPLNYVEMIEAGHGGIEAHDYANPTNTAPDSTYFSQDVNGNQWVDIAALNPDLVLIFLGFNDIANSRTAADFQSSLTTIVSLIDAASSRVPDILFVTYPFLDSSNPAIPNFSRADWAAYETAAKNVADALGIRADYLWLSDYLGPLDVTDEGTFTDSSDGVHPLPFGHHMIGDVIAARLADTFVTMTPSTSLSFAPAATVTAKQDLGTLSSSIATSASALASIPVPIAPTCSIAFTAASDQPIVPQLISPTSSITFGATGTAQTPGEVPIECTTSINFGASASAQAAADLGALSPSVTTTASVSQATVALPISGSSSAAFTAAATVSTPQSIEPDPVAVAFAASGAVTAPLIVGPDPVSVAFTSSAELHESCNLSPDAVSLTVAANLSISVPSNGPATTSMLMGIGR